MNPRHSIRLFALLGAFTLTSAADAGETATTWVATGLNEKVWRNVAMEVDALGQVVAVTNSYTELATGLCWWNEDTTSFEETKEEFEIAEDGTAVAARGQHKVFIKPNINEGGAVDMLLPDGQRFRSNPMGLSYFDLASRKNVLLGEIKDCRGEQIAPNVIWFPDAFDTVKAGIRLTYTKDGFEQDIILYENPGAPEEYGLNSRSTTLECYTELYDIREPERGRLSEEAGEEDPVLDFGSLRMQRGTAYFLNEQVDEGVPVRKTYEVIEGSRRFLIEHVPYVEVAPVLERLQARATKPGAEVLARRSFPSRAELAAAVKPRSLGVELAGIQRRERTLPAGLVLDYYATLNSPISNYVFTNACTFYVSGAVSVSGSLTIEPSCVVKYASGASLNCGSATLTLKTEPYSPALFTAKDDDTVGSQISGSTGNPSGYYANPALQFTSGNRQLQHLRISHAQQGIFFYDYSASGNNVVSHAQFVHCYTPMQFNGYGSTFQNFQVRNVLITNAYTAFKGYSFNGTVEHLTANGCTYLAHDYNGQLYGTTSSLSLKNTLLCGIGTDYLSRYVAINRNSPYTQTVTSGSFTGVGAGGHYLGNAAYRNVGTTDINATLLSEIKTRTTYPPQLLAGPVEVSTTLGPRALRDGDRPDLGYHYAPLDYVANTLVVNNAALTLTNGVAIGLYGDYGIWLQSGSTLVSEGSALARNHLTRFTCVQEASTNWGGGSVANNLAVLTYCTAGPYPTVNMRFTDFESPANDGTHLRLDPFTLRVAALTLRDCKVQGGNLSLATASGDTHLMANNVFATAAAGFGGGATLTLYNNLFYRGSATFDNDGVGTWTVKDNHFHLCSIADGFGGITHSHNAYVMGSTSLGQLTPTNTAGNLVLTNFVFAPGALGSYYQHSTNLQEAGSLSDAAQRGLYHHTTTSNQKKEGNTPLDVGFHYVAVELGPEPSASGLVGRWRFDEGTGTMAYDSSGLGHTGTLLNGAAWSSGQTGSAITAGDPNGYVSALESSALRLPGDITVACWMRKSAEPSDWSRIVGKGGGSTRNYGLWEEPGGNRILLQQVTSSAIYCQLWSTTVTEVGKWYHVAAVRSGTTARLYINGVQESTGTFSGTMVTSSDPLTIGYALFHTYFKGSIDDVRVYSRALSATEIAVLASRVCDVDGDGIPDYLEDRNGNGVCDPGSETDWQTDSLGLGGPAGLQVFTPLK